MALPAFGEDALLGDRAEGSTQAEAKDVWLVENGAGEFLGTVLQTAPESNPFVGFSGPTNMLLAFDREERLLRMEILSSQDTRDHVRLIQKDPNFLHQWRGLSKNELLASADVRGVAGATLTSVAIVQGIQKRLGGELTTGKFTEPVSLDLAKQFFPDCQLLDRDSTFPSLWRAKDPTGREVGWLLRTSPTADNIVGYQGPTDALLAFAPDGSIVGLHVGKSFDNEPYVGYVRNDAWFQTLWKKERWPELAKLDLQEAGVEGVSGATMTSMAVAESLVDTAKAYQDALRQHEIREPQWRIAWERHAGTIAIALLATLFALSSWRGNRKLRLVFQGGMIFYLGLVQGDLLSIAMWTGWAQNGVPWSGGLGLVVLTIAALAIPIATKRNVYCSHICPYGAIQQILPRRWKLKTPHPKWLSYLLRAIRPALIAWIFCVVFLAVPGNLVDIEPFDAFLWRVAAVPSLLIAIGGLLLSLRIPMGYCQHGCVTGSVINYLRPGTNRKKLEKGDWLAISFLLLAFVVSWWYA